MKLRQKQPIGALMAPDRAHGSDHLNTQHSPHAESCLTFQTTSIEKMFSTEQRYAVLIKTEVETSDGLADEFVALTGAGLTWNQLLSRATGPCLKRALLETNSVSQAANAFAFKARVTTTDQAGSNTVAEQLMCGSRGKAWTGLHLYCNAHHTARALTKTMSLVENHISGLINFALSLSVGSSMQTFRATVTEIVQERLVILRGQAPAEALAYRDFVIATFAATGTRQEERAFLLTNLCNGDWRNKQQVEVYVAGGVDIDEGVLRSNVVQGLLSALCGKSFSTYPRHRWLGCDVSTDQFALLEAVHGLGSATYRRFLEKVSTTSGRHRSRGHRRTSGHSRRWALFGVRGCLARAGLEGAGCRERTQAQSHRALALNRSLSERNPAPLCDETLVHPAEGLC